MSTRLVFLGPPGAGKGTQARQLAATLKVPPVATGEMLREAVANQTWLGLDAKRYMNSGGLVPDEVVIGLVAERLAQPDVKHGFILDGFPRTVAQAEALRSLLGDRSLELDRVVFFEVAREELVRRLTGRRICRQCGATFHLVSAPPRVAERCDACAGELYQREDDTEATVARRLDVYEVQTAPLLQYYRSRNLLSSVRGEGAVDQVTAELRRTVAKAVTA